MLFFVKRVNMFRIRNSNYCYSASGATISNLTVVFLTSNEGWDDVLSNVLHIVDRNSALKNLFSLIVHVPDGVS